MSEVLRSHMLFRSYNKFWEPRSGETLVVGGNHGEFVPKKKIGFYNDVRRTVGLDSIRMFNRSTRKMSNDVINLDWSNSAIAKVHQSRWHRVKYNVAGTLGRLFNFAAAMQPADRAQMLDELEEEAIQMFLSVGHKTSILVTAGDGWLDALRDASSTKFGAEEWEAFWTGATGFEEEAHTLAKAAAKFLSVKQGQFIYAPADIMRDTTEVQDILFRCFEPVVCSASSMRYDNSIVNINLACHTGGDFMMGRFNSRELPVVGNLFDPPNINQSVVVSCKQYPTYDGTPMEPGNFYSVRFMNFYCLIGYAEVAGGRSSMAKPVNVGQHLAGGLSHVEHSLMSSLS